MTWRGGTWDYVMLEGERLTGRVLSFNIAPTRNIESTPVPGLDGVDLRDQGYAGSPVTIVLELIKSAQYDLLAAQMATLNPRQPGIAIKPRKIDHPITRFANITHVYIIGFACGMPDDTGKWQVTINAFQFAKSKKKSNATPLSSAGGSLDIDVDVKPNPAGAGAHFP